MPPAFVTLTHPDAKKDRAAYLPTRAEVQHRAREQVQICSACGENPQTSGKILKKCASCKTSMYCSRECQVADWPTHKKSCVQERDITLKLAKKLMANDYLMYMITLYAVLHLDLLNNPTAANSTALYITLKTSPADPMASLQALFMNGGEAPEEPANTRVMLQVSSIGAMSLGDATPAMRSSLQETKKGLKDKLEGYSETNIPVVLMVFTGDGTNVIARPFPILPEVLDHAKKQTPFKIKSAMLGEVDVPLTESSIIENFNNAIYMDKENRFMVRTTQKS